MKKVLMIYAVLIAGILIWYYGVGKEKRVADDSKGLALKVSKHSLQFNRSMDDIMRSYYALADGFVKADIPAVEKSGAGLLLALDSLKLDELRRDSSIYQTAVSIWEDTKTEIGGMLGDSALQSKRESLNLLSNELFTLLLTIRYDLAKLYWQECATAFGEDTPGNWISPSDQTKNPYGKQDCAVVKKVINFTPADSARK